MWKLGGTTPTQNGSRRSQQSAKRRDKMTDLIHQLPLEDVERGRVAQSALPPALHTSRGLEHPAREPFEDETAATKRNAQK